jgi:hypothetical protein
MKETKGQQIPLSGDLLKKKTNGANSGEPKKVSGNMHDLLVTDFLWRLQLLSRTVGDQRFEIEWIEIIGVMWLH